METPFDRAIAIVGISCVLPDAPDAGTFWKNVTAGRYSISEVDPARWDPTLYYDPDPSAPDKTYSTIGGWVREAPWDPLGWKLPIPPRVNDAMDEAQRWAVSCTRAALLDWGWPAKQYDPDRTAVILGNAMAGEKHYQTALRIALPEYVRALEATPSWSGLPSAAREALQRELAAQVDRTLPRVTEDTMPGELANCMAGRVANLFNFHGPNFVTDAACASAMAAISAAIAGLLDRDFDLVVTGGIDRNMGAATYVKFCKIGALSATGTRPYGDGADGFVMGEGAALFLLKRLADAERDGDRIYAVIRGIGGSSDGKGKGITAPNPAGQLIAIRHAWQDAGVRPDRGTMIEGHGTSTRVGDVVEVESLASAFAGTDLPPGTIPLGSVKSNIGHLKGAAGAAGLLKAALALHEKVLPPSLNAERPNPNIDFAKLPFAVNHTLRPWEVPAGTVRRAGVSAFGFGGTNFHVVLEEHIPGRLASEGNGRRRVAVPSARPASAPAVASVRAVPPRGALVVGGPSVEALRARLQAVQSEAAAGRAPAPAAPEPEALRAPERVAIDYGDARELADKCAKALKALAADTPPAWKALRAQGIFRGRGTRPKVAFLYTGQGSQYVNMLAGLRASEPIVAETFAEADRVMTPLLGRPLTSYLFVDPADPALVAQAEEDLRQTAITQPAVLAVDIALTRLLAAHGIQPDCVMGHSLGEYGALVAADALPFADALEAVSARGREMTNLAVEDNGAMAAILAPIEEIEKIVAGVQGYVVIANVNSRSQAVIGGATAAVQAAIAACQAAGFTAIPLPVSHAFHTRIVAPASEPLRRTLQRLRLAPPRIPVIANVSGDWYPTGPDAVARMLDILAEQVASPVQFVRGLETLHRAGVRVFVEVGPKKALAGFVEDVLGSDPEVVSLFTNHPKLPDAVAFNQALCGLFAAGFGASSAQAQPAEEGSTEAAATPALTRPASATLAGVAPHRVASTVPPPSTRDGDTYTELGRLFAGVLERGWQLLGRGEALAPGEPVVISGAGLGLPGPGRIFGDDTVGRLLRGEQMIDVIPMRFRRAMLDKHITRLVKSDEGGPVFQTIDDLEEVIKLAGRGGEFDLAREYGIPAERIAAYDVVTRLAIAAGFEALRDAGIPLVMRYRTTSTGGRLPEGWRLPADMADDTGIVFASVFPGYDAFADEMERYHRDRARREHLADLEALRARLDGAAYGTAVAELDRRIHDLRAEIARDPYQFDRRFLFRILAMGHSQFAELVGARGPNTQINAACASTTQAISVAEDWIRTGRCRRVIVLSADDASGEHLLEWIGAGFLASGAAATDDVVEKAALPFDRRRHGMLIGMGAAAFVLESAAAARERGIAPLCEVLAATSANSAFHGTRLDVEHICQVMERLVREAEARGGIDRRTFASQTVFVSHETYTPARGGSAAAEVEALRKVFGADAQRIVVANTKGYTGHPMGVGIEDVLAVKALETGLVPAVPNFREPDPELGVLNLSKGGMYPVEYALRLGAGFGSQIAMTLLRRVPPPGGVRPALEALGYQYRIADVTAWEGWLARAAGRSGVTLEVVDRKLRIRDEAVSQREAQPPAVAPVRPQPAPTPPSTLASPARGADAAAPAASPPPPSVVSARPAAPPSPAAAAGTPTGDPLAERVLALVAEKTGYPRDMLDLDLDLEADLGIDTVKQAEMFATIREAWDIPRDPKLKLRDFPTLRHVIQFVRDRRPDLAAPQAPAPAATPAPAAAAAAPAAADEIAERVLALVAEKTGYPRDMLDLDLDLEADLGIDTVKQAEMFATIREAWDIPRDPKLKLRDFPTLRHVIQFVRDRRPDLAAAAPAPAATTPPPAATAPAAAAPAADEIAERVLALVAEKTGYPRDMLDLDLDLEADLGIDTVKQAEMFATIREAWDIPRDPKLKLRDFPTLRHVIQFVRDRRPDLAAAAPAPAATTPPPAATAPAAAAPAADEIAERVLALVAEKTGYPRDMLDLDLDLEADLGIDTVKQAEMFATIREAWDIPRDPKLKLRDFPTLRHVIQFVRDRRPDLAALQAPAPAATPTPATALTAVAATFPRRVVVPVLRPPLEVCKETGARLDPGNRVLLVPDRGGIGDALAAELRGRGVEPLVAGVGDDTDALLSAVNGWLETGPIHGVYWLPALDPEPSLMAMDLATWRLELDARVKRLHAVMQRLYDQEIFLVSATRLGGFHGYDEAGAWNPMGGAVTGFTKAFKREQGGRVVKAVDFPPDWAPADIARTLVEETLRDPGAVEIGRHRDERWSPGLVEQPLGTDGTGLPLGPETVMVVTGGAGSIVAAIVADLAAACRGGHFHLLDRVAAPAENDPDVARIRSDREGLKRELFERLKARGERATPAMIERELAAIERSAAAATALEAVRAAGGQAHWHAVDLLDGDAVQRAVGEVCARHGRIDVLVHAAGLEISRALPDKTAAEFARVLDVKCDGWFSLLRAIGDTPLGATVVFSSIAGRFGNAGQTDYAAANDLLCKWTSHLRRLRPGTRALAIDWTAWAEIGMASRGSIPTIMAAAGIDMLPPSVGIPVVRNELGAGTAGEVVVAGRLGILQQPFDATGGVDPERLQQRAPGPMIGQVVAASLDEGLVVETTLDPRALPFLDHHRIDGIPVLPGVMGMEAFAEVARLAAPGWHPVAVESVDFLAPVKFHRDQPRTLRLAARVRPGTDGLTAECTLSSSRLLPGRDLPEVTVNFRGRVQLGSAPPPALRADVPPIDSAAPHVEAAAIYRIYFHGPAYQVLRSVHRVDGGAVGIMASDLPPDLPTGAASPLTRPREAELCFQAAGILELARTGALGLPQHVGTLEITDAGPPSGRVLAVVAPAATGRGVDVRVMDESGTVRLVMREYRTIALPASVDEAERAPMLGLAS